MPLNQETKPNQTKPNQLQSVIIWQTGFFSVSAETRVREWKLWIQTSLKNDL